jgi:magnesium-protoporphyrin IX monomethyl ester (oxidative) cyclase
MTPRVVLVVPPLQSVVRPALGVSLLMAALARTRIGARVEYLSLRYAEEIGVDLNERLADMTPRHMLAEWIFAAAANGRGIASFEEAYLDDLAASKYANLLQTIVDLRHSIGPFIDRSARQILEDRPAIVGFSTMFEQNCASAAIAARVRELDPDVTICFGGANCEGPMGEALLEIYPQIDFVFQGEADRTFPEFVRRALDGESIASSTASVIGRSAAAARPPNEQSFVQDLDGLPLPDFSDYFAALGKMSFGSRVKPALPIETSRGCWWGAKKHCRFCGLNGSSMVYRSKSSARVLHEIEELNHQWGVSRFEAVDNIMDLKHVEGVFGVLADRSTDYRFVYEIKSNMSETQLKRIARGGVTAVQPGVESLHDRILQLMEKGVTALQNVRLLRSCAEAGMRTMWNLLAGFPGEKASEYEWMASIVPMIEHLDPPTGVCSIRLDRFSPYFERANDLGFGNVRPQSVYRALYGASDEILFRLAYFFDGDASDLPDGDYTAALRRAVENWRRRRFEQAEAPVLSLVQFQGVSAVNDTRSCASESWCILGDTEIAVVDAFRIPSRVEATLARLKSGTPRLDHASAFRQLVERKFVLVDDDRAVTLIVDPSERIHDDVGYDPPWGSVIVSQFAGAATCLS